MGNYLPKSGQSLESCSISDFQRALQCMGGSHYHETYSPLLLVLSTKKMEGELEALLQGALKRPALFADLFQRIGIDNALHRMILENQLRTHHQAMLDNNNNNMSHADDDNTPQDLVDIMAAIGAEWNDASTFTIYSQAVQEHCLTVGCLGKIRKLEQWTVVFEGLGCRNILHQNVLYNRIMDVANERNPKRNNKKRKLPPPVVAEQDDTPATIMNSMQPKSSPKRSLTRSCLGMKQSSTRGKKHASWATVQ
ncbi:expressed unknown protein [Seminavis robusta]|uniref:Uncharacterized protein n=1 Tax=Seminavis robusta TaxID=568900 RepID=A0A9N8EN22_9STRA|nr:expressed unknown protein [Seminavis robusta]|eukprot:Sro1504_g278130.1 n/a (252) ;mRNA; r:16507-17262